MSLFFIISFYFCILSFSNQQIINNPIKSNKKFNQIDYIIICNSQNAIIKRKDYTIKEDSIKYIQNSYIISQSLILCNDVSNNKFFLLKNKYYKVNKITNFDIQAESLVKELDTGLKYLGFFKIFSSSKTQLKDEIVIYGTSDKKLIFNLVNKGRKFTENIGINNEQISCKSIADYSYICSFSDSGKIKIDIFYYKIDSINNNNNVYRQKFKSVDRMTYHENPILYDTSHLNYKILCAKKILNNHIDCLAISILNINLPYSDINNNIRFFSLDNTLKTSFSYEEDNCNFTEFNSEYLLCCSKSDRISCDRRKMDFNLITNFNINHPGKNSNLTLEKSNDNIKLIYSNCNNNNIKYIYEYFIYPPVCKNKQISITSYQTGKVGLSDLFERKTNTKYYISFDNVPTNFAELKINEKIIKNKEKILIENKEKLFIYNFKR